MAEKTLPTYPAPLPFKPRLRTVKAAKSTFEKIMRLYAAGELDNESMRVWVYSMSQFQNYLKLDNEQEFQRRVERLETIICEKLPDGSYRPKLTEATK